MKNSTCVLFKFCFRLVVCLLPWKIKQNNWDTFRLKTVQSISVFPRDILHFCGFRLYRKISVCYVLQVPVKFNYNNHGFLCQVKNLFISKCNLQFVIRTDCRLTWLTEKIPSNLSYTKIDEKTNIWTEELMGLLRRQMPPPPFLQNWSEVFHYIFGSRVITFLVLYPDKPNRNFLFNWKAPLWAFSPYMLLHSKHHPLFKK